MKTTFLTLALAASSFLAVAQSKTVALASANRPATAAPAAATTAYQQTMLAAIAEQGTLKTVEDAQANAAKLEAAAAAVPGAWEPRYYQARAYLKVGSLQKDSQLKDQAFAQAQTALNQARQQPGADQAEILLVEAFLFQGMLMSAPAERGQEYSTKVSEALKQVKTLAPTNPRLYLLLGNELFFCPAEYGGGADKAKPLYEQSKALFASFKPATALSPVWGEKTVDVMLAKVAAAPAAK